MIVIPKSELEKLLSMFRWMLIKQEHTFLHYHCLKCRAEKMLEELADFSPLRVKRIKR